MSNFYYSTSSSCKNEFCIIASALASSLFATAFFSKKQLQEDFEQTLDEAQKEIYSKIRKERKFISIIGLIVGLVLGFGTYKFQRNLCMSISVIVTSTIMVYKLWPKSDYIMNHVYSNNQSKAWMKIYNHMNKLSDIGMLVGAVLYMILKQLL